MPLSTPTLTLCMGVRNLSSTKVSYMFQVEAVSYSFAS
ncbi:hypothetical protein BVRB_4g085760 [Beta vulgaris subsp. vulgaris]|nr:hypothetical protein BVRB_4g085760 [Beta vulgaris subsp. vulgaris]